MVVQELNSFLCVKREKTIFFDIQSRYHTYPSVLVRANGIIRIHIYDIVNILAEQDLPYLALQHNSFLGQI